MMPHLSGVLWHHPRRYVCDDVLYRGWSGTTMDTLSPRQSGYMCAPGACMLGGHRFEGPQAYWLPTRALCFSALQSCSTRLGWPILLAEALVGIWSARMLRKVARWDLIGLDGSLRAMCLLWAPRSWVPVNSLIKK